MDCLPQRMCQLSIEEKKNAVKHCFEGGESVKSVSKEPGLQQHEPLKAPGTDWKTLKNREKAVMISAMKTRVSLDNIIKELDKYLHLREKEFLNLWI